MGESADQLYQRGRHLATRGSYLDAKRSLAAAAEAADADGDTELSARIAGTTAYVLARLGDVDAGERICLEALDRPGLSAGAVAQLQGQLGMLATERGRIDEAIGWFGKSIHGLSDEPVRQANTRVNRSIALMQTGKLAAAIEDLEAAEEVYRTAGLEQEANLAVHNRGYALMLGGDLVAALRTMQSVREPLDSESALWAAINELDRAEVLRDAGLTTEAERSLVAVAASLGRHHAPSERAAAEYQLARSLLNHDPERAATVAGNAARRFRRVGSPGGAARAEAVRLRARLSTRNHDRSGDPLSPPGRLPSKGAVDGVAGRLADLGFSADAEVLVIADALARVRRGSATAAPAFRVAKNTRLESALLVQELRAADAMRRHRNGEARRHAQRGLDLLDASFTDGASLDLHGSVMMRGLGLLTVGLGAALRSGRPDTVFDWSERARLGSERVVPVRPSPDPGLAADLAELRVLRMNHPDGGWLADPRARALQDRAREHQWSGTGAAGLQRRVTLTEVQTGIAPGEALANFVFDGERLVVLVVDCDDAVMTELDWAACRRAMRGLRADLDVHAAVSTGPMAEIVRTSLTDRLAALSAALLEPWLARVGASRVALTIPGVLAGVPWAMLPAFRGVAISVAGSASGWLRRREQPYRTPASAGFAVGPRVPRGEEEVLLAADSWRDPAVLTGGAAEVRAVTALAGDVDVLHVAAHGRHALDNPMFSGFELADGTLFGYDIDLIPEVPDTVILSACEVGRSSVRWGEEAVGMTRIWLHAGARAVIAAPVVVADDDACELLGAVHEGLAAGIAPSEALAAASVRTGIVAPFQVHGAGF
ncbi:MULTISPECIES: CHAT domain-containing protein [Microbacterium]|uniref:CHAT domain protein n=1 Tax=Microbacterium trichothecenolyticum TaxID=69370 RepID=A0A0M2H340_MICTR|nr:MULTISPECIES: CHAT domain-containing protein [Microbacterium]KJL40683.1 CHAT domain protein [Microbacterium trichothecenolyticum]MDR7188565.1 tetratricopeptide (TPR) repeat protein [Microbacterium sp. BE35]